MTKTFVSLDIATSKVACLIAQPNENGEMCLKGVGYSESTGLENGNVTNKKSTIQAIGAAVGQAEKMFGQNISGVSINIAGDSLKSRNLTIRREYKIAHSVDRNAIMLLADDLIEQLDSEKDSRRVIHLVPFGFVVDKVRNDNPSGIVGKNLEVEFHGFFSEKSKISAFDECFKKVKLDVKHTIFEGFASALGVLNDYEMENGALVIDIGAGITSFAIIKGYRFIFGNSFPIAGNTITADIADVLGTSFTIAEKIKLLNVNLYLDDFEESEIIRIDIDGDETFRVASNKKKIINDIFKSRLEEIVGLILEIVSKKSLIGEFDTMVLTGGTVNVPGVDSFITKSLRQKVRIGLPIGFSISEGIGISENEIHRSSYATAVGMLNFLKYLDRQREIENRRNRSGNLARGVLDFVVKLFLGG